MEKELGKNVGDLENEISALKREVAVLRQSLLQNQQTLNALREKETLLRTMLLNLPIDFWARDLSGQVILQSNQSIDRWGDQRRQLSGAQNLPVETRRIWEDNNQRALNGETVKGETIQTDPYGGVHYIYNFVVPILDQDRITGVMGVNLDITQRKMLEESRRMFEFIVERAGDAVFRVTPEGRIDYANQAACQTLGYDRDELTGMDIWDINATLPPGVWPRHWREIQRFRTMTLESVLRTRDQNEFPVEITVNHLKHEGREYAISFARNILARKKAEKALEQSEEKYRLLFSKALDGILMVDAETWRVVEANEALVRMTGFSRMELLSLRPETLSIDPVNSYKRLRRLLMLPYEFMGPGHYRRKNQSTFPVEISAVSFDWNGRPTIMAIIRDVTQRHTVEEALRKSEEKYRLLVENAQEGIGVVQEEGVRYANPVLLHNSGYTEDDLPKLRAFDLIHPDDRTELIELYRKVLARQTDVPRSRPTRLIRPDGSVWWALISGVLIDWEERPAVMVLTSNITDLKAGERELKAALSEKVVLLREIHHRVKNNMQVVSSLLSLQARKTKEDGLKRAFEDVRSRVMAMALVHETLYQSSSLSAIDLKLYVQKLAGILGAAHGANRRRLALVLEVDSLPIGIDHAVPCGLIINELAVNAFQHAFPQDGPGRISITARETKDGKVQLIVADDGIGLPPDAERPMSNTLGLTLVRGLARQQLGGELNVDVNGGTRFTITFPNRERSVEPPDLIS